MRSLAFAIAILATPVTAHEYWIEPHDYQIATDGNLTADLVNGQNFDGTRFAYVPQRSEQFDVIHDGAIEPVQSRAGSKPALNEPAHGDGLTIIAFVSTPTVLVYDEFDKFLRFADHKGFETAEADHMARGLPTDRFREVYTRYSKALIGVGSASGDDQNLGLETELVALDNPYLLNGADTMRVQSFYQGEPRANAQIELFEKDANGAVEITYHQTDANGIATLPARPGHSYLADAVVLREPAPDLAEEKDAVWETLWAALTYAIPQ